MFVFLLVKLAYFKFASCRLFGKLSLDDMFFWPKCVIGENVNINYKSALREFRFCQTAPDHL